MASLNDIYGGIIKPGPQGGIYQPGPDVQFPNSNVSRVTPEGLNVRSVSTYGVDGNGNPIAKPTASQLQALKVVANALVSPSQRNANDIVRDIPATGTANTARPYTTDAANALDYNRLGLTATAREPAPLAAIDAATVMRPSMRPGSFFANGALPFLGGDPGIPTHVGGDNGLYGRPAQGFATVPNGPPIMRAAAPAARQPVMVAAPPPPNVTNNINRFLSEQGINTQGMTAGEQANALRNAMGGSHNGEFH